MLYFTIEVSKFCEKQMNCNLLDNASLKIANGIILLNPGQISKDVQIQAKNNGMFLEAKFSFFPLSNLFGIQLPVHTYESSLGYVSYVNLGFLSKGMNCLNIN